MFRCLSKLLFSLYFILLASDLFLNIEKHSKTYKEKVVNLENYVLNTLNVKIPEQLLSKNYLSNEILFVHIIGYAYIALISLALLGLNKFYFLTVSYHLVIQIVYHNLIKSVKNRECNCELFTTLLLLFSMGIILSENRNKKIDSNKKCKLL